MTRIARLALTFGLGYLLIAWALVVVVDFMNFDNAQGWVTNELQPLPLLWYALFSEASPAENLQWLLIGTALVAGGKSGTPTYRDQTV